MRCPNLELIVAMITIPDENRSLREPGGSARDLAAHGIDYEDGNFQRDLPADASAAQVLALREQIEKSRCKVATSRGRHLVTRTLPVGCDVALFNIKHTHEEDEVRYIIEGEASHIHPAERPVVAIEVEAGDLIRVLAARCTGLILCWRRRIRADSGCSRDKNGLAAHLQEASGVDRNTKPFDGGRDTFATNRAKVAGRATIDASQIRVILGHRRNKPLVELFSKTLVPYASRKWKRL